MSAQTTVTRVRRAVLLDAILATLAAVILGFVLGFASQAWAAEPEDPGLAIAEARANLDAGVTDVVVRSQQARADDDEPLAHCIAERVLVLKGVQVALRNAEDDYALARMRGDERAAQVALDRAAKADHTGTVLLTEARGCASTDAILGRANGVTVLRVKRPKGSEDRGFGPPRRRAAPPVARN